ncbi:MAG: tyrosine--tRNA ligase [Alphaproteobacteria bacterium]|nr:tyrosine--tRNA ligase [Alphaproteobacteria bacterium]
MAQPNFLSIIKSRGFFHQCTDEAGLASLTSEQKAVPAYIGFDCTAKSLHVGSLMQIMLLRWWQKCGHKPIVLMGGGTTKVGDPTGRDESRPQLTDADIQANMDGIKQVFAKFLTFGDGPSDAVMVNNDEWLSGIRYLDFLRDYGRHFSINRMLTMDSVKLRIDRDQHMSFLEFNYMILQAYDFVELNKHYGCRLQMGGSDQWGNIVMGVELNRRLLSTIKPEAKDNCDSDIRSDISAAVDEVTMNHDKYLFGMTSPLMTTASGAKMGKTASGAVWLSADMLSPYDYWQFWRNTEDADVGKFLKLFTELDVAECERLGALQGAEINEAKKILATEATTLLHGREAAELAARTAQETFERGGTSADLPEVLMPAAELEAGMPAYAFFVKIGFATSNGEARRLIAGKGARINDAVVEEPDMTVSRALLLDSGFIKVSSGKKKHVLVKPA